MKKIIRNILLMVICLFVTENLVVLDVNAAEKSEISGIEISISSDKDEYVGSENATILYSIKNNNDNAFNGLNWNLKIPDGFITQSGNISGNDIRIGAAETIEGSAVIVKDTVETTMVTTNASTTSIYATTTTNKTDSAKTGDNSNIIISLTIITIAAILAVFTCRKSKKAAKFFCFMLSAVCISALMPSNAFSVENERVTANADRTIKVDNTDYKVEFSISFDPEAYVINVSNQLYAWADYNKKDNTIIINWLEQEGAVSYKVYDKSLPEHELAEVTDSTEYVYNLSESDAKDKYVFYIKKCSEKEKSISNDVIVNRDGTGKYTFEDIDSDNDGLNDFKEINRKTNRLNPDSDNDGLLDGYEYLITKTDPLLFDTDLDGVSDGQEDYEGDGLTNSQEYYKTTNPFSGDTDNDGFPDGYEIENYMDPLTCDEIKIDNNKISQIKDYTEYDLEILNANKEYPLEVYYNDDGNIERINGVFTSDRIKSAQDALLSLYNIKSLIGINDPSAELKYIKTVFNQCTTSYSFGMIYNGLEVEGRNITVTCLKDGTISSLFSGYLSHEFFEGLNTKPDISESELSNIINKDSDNKTEVILSDLCIRIDSKPLLVYRIITKSNEIVWIDAHTGEVLERIRDMDNISGTSQLIDAVGETGETLTGINVMVDDSGSADRYYLYDDVNNIAVYLFNNNDPFLGDAVGEDYNELDLPDIIDPDGFNASFGYDDGSGIIWDGQAVSAYYNFKIAFDKYARKGYVGLNGKGGPSVIFVHYLNDQGDKDNAYYTQPRYDRDYDHIMITDTDKLTYSYATDLGVIGHEFGHGLVHHLSMSHYNRFMKTVNEAYADIFGSWVQNEWMVDERPGRNIPNPHESSNPVVYKDTHLVPFEDPNDASKTIYKPAYDINFTDEHQNTTIISHAAYILNDRYNYSMEEIYYLFVESLPSLSDSYSSFGQIEAALIAAARSLNYTSEKIEGIYHAFNEVGIDLPKGNAKILVKEGSTPVSNTCITISNYSDSKTRYTDGTGHAIFEDLKVGTYKMKIWAPDREPIYTSILITENHTREKIIDFLTADTDYDWDIYDHEDYMEKNGVALEKHITITESNIEMNGYVEVPFKDFLLTHENDNINSFIHSPNKILSFNLHRDRGADWHTMEGGGFLFDVSISGKDEENEGMLTAHCVLLTKSGLKIFYLHDVDISEFRNGNPEYIATLGERYGNVSYKIGDVADEHSISISIQKGTTEKISIFDNGELIIDNLEINRLDGDDYGPIISHKGHDCNQVSYFIFSEIQMSNVY